MVEWRILPQFPNYMVSTHGHIRAFLPPGRADRYQEILPRHNPRRHRYSVQVRDWRGDWQDVLLARLIALAFLGPPGKSVLRYRNGDYTDVRLANIKYSTAVHKLTPEIVREIRRSQQSIHSQARKYGVTPGTISRVLHRRAWLHV